MSDYEYIVDPNTTDKIKSNSVLGKNIIRNYGLLSDTIRQNESFFEDEIDTYSDASDFTEDNSDSKLTSNSNSKSILLPEKKCSKNCILGCDEITKLCKSIKVSDLELIFSKNDTLNLFLKLVFGYQKILILYYLMIYNPKDKINIQNYLQECRNQYIQNNTDKSGVNDTSIDYNIGKCISDYQNKYKNLMMLSLPQLIDYLIKNKIKLIFIIKEILNNTESDDELIDSINSKFDDFILKKDKEYGIYKESCDLDIKHKNYDYTIDELNNLEKTKQIQLDKYKSASKSPSLKNLGYKNNCPKFHRIVKTDKDCNLNSSNKFGLKGNKVKCIEEGCKWNKGKIPGSGTCKSVIEKEIECCIYRPLTRLKAQTNKIISAKKISGIVWNEQELKDYLHEYQNYLMKTEQQIENKIQIFRLEKEKLNENDKETRWLLNKKINTLSLKLKEVQNNEIIPEKKILEGWKRAEQEYSAWRASHIGINDIEFEISDIITNIIYNFEIFIKKHLYTDKYENSNILSYNSVINLMKMSKNRTIDGFMFILKHPRLMLGLSTILLETKNSWCRKKSLELGYYQLEEPEVYDKRISNMSLNLKLIYKYSSDLFLSFVGPDSSDKITAGCGQISGILKVVFGSIPGAGFISSSIDGFTTILTPFVKQGLEAYIWKEIYSRGLLNIITLINPVNCIHEVPIRNEIYDVKTGVDAWDDSMPDKDSLFGKFLAALQPKPGTPQHDQLFDEYDFPRRKYTDLAKNIISNKESIENYRKSLTPQELQILQHEINKNKK